MKRYDLFILDSTKALVASMQDAVWELSETLNVEDTLRAALFEADKFSLVTAENTFIRLVNASDSTDKRTYRLTSVEESRIDGRHALQCEGARIWADMGREIYEGWHPFKNIQVKTIVAELLGSSAFQIKSGGSAESDTTIIEALDFAYTTVLEAMQRIAEKADLEIEIDESTSPESIDLKTRGASNNTRFEYGINTSGMARRFRRAEVVNKVYPVGGGSPPATCKGALFEVYSISTATITVAGNKCISSDDTYNTYKIKMVTGGDAGTSFTINDTTRGSSGDDDTIVLSTTPGSVSAGDLFMFTDASGNELDFVPDAVSQAAYGTFDGVVRDQQFEEIRTLITPGFMDGTYASGLHDGWTKTGTPTVAEETGIDYIQHGSASQHVTAASDTHGIYYDVSLDSSDYYSCAVNLNVVSGSVLVKITTTGSTGAVEYKNQGGTSGTGWLTVELEGLPIEGATATLTIQATGGAAEFYVDAVSFTGTQQTRQFVRENGARELYRMAFDYLDENDAPMVEYDLPNALDLYAIDSTKYPFYDVSVGDTVTVIDPGMSLAASVRVLSLGYDSHGRQLRVKLSSHTSTSAAFSQVAPGIGRVIQQGRKIAQDEIDGNRTNENALSIANRLNKIAGNSARASRFTGTFTATGQTSFDVGSGTLYVGTSLAYTIGAQTLSGLSGGSVYYLYFDPTSASSGLQTTTTAATAYATDNIQVGVLKTGSTSNDNVQIFDTTGAQVSGEVITRGLEAYDTGGTKRIDIGVLQDPSASIGNPGTWGIQVTDGAHQTTSLLAEYTGAIPGAVRYLYSTFGDEDEDLTYSTTTQVLYNDFSVMFAKSSANMYLGMYNGQLVAGSSGDLYGHELSSLLNSGSGNVRALNIGVTQSSGGGHAYGLYVGDSLGVRSTSTGNAYGIYIAAVSSTSGSAYSIYDATTNRARFGGSISVRGVDYVWPSSDGTGGYFLSTDGSGNLSWAAGGGGLSGSGSTNYVSKWTGASALGDSIIYDNGSAIGIGTASIVGTKVHVLGSGLLMRFDDASATGNPHFDFSQAGTQKAFIQYADADDSIHYSATGGHVFDIYGGTSNVIIINTSGNVGIGMTPTQTLDVSGTFACSSNAQVGGTLSAQGTLSVSGTTTNLNIISTSSGVNYSALNFYENTSTQSAQIGFNNSTNLFAIGTIVSGNVSIATNNTTRATFDTNGRLGIATGSPSSTLHIYNSSAGSTVGIRLENNSGTDWAIGEYDFNNTFAIHDITNAITRFCIEDNGNVGFGLNNPSVAFEVRGSSTMSFNFETTATTGTHGMYLYENTTTLASSWYFNASTNVVTFGNAQNADLNIITNNSTRMIIEADGDVGIGATPSYKFHVADNTTSYVMEVENSASSGDMGGLLVYFTGSAPDNNTSQFLVCRDNSALRCIIWGDGDIANDDNTYGSISDFRLKTDINVARSYWEDFKRLQFKTFKKTYDGELGQNRFGLIAQEVQEVFPSLVQYGNDGFLWVKNSVIHEIGMSVLIETQNRVETIEEKVERLETENAELTSRIELLEAA